MIIFEDNPQSLNRLVRPTLSFMDAHGLVLGVRQGKSRMVVAFCIQEKPDGIHPVAYLSPVADAPNELPKMLNTVYGYDMTILSKWIAHLLMLVENKPDLDTLKEFGADKIMFSGEYSEVPEQYIFVDGENIGENPNTVAVLSKEFIPYDIVPDGLGTSFIERAAKKVPIDKERDIKFFTDVALRREMQGRDATAIWETVKRIKDGSIFHDNPSDLTLSKVQQAL